jgi:radical SAM protein with 4Fe4S-binding SPASM domain
MTELLIKSVFRHFYRRINAPGPLHRLARKASFSLLNFKYRTIKLHVNNTCNLRCEDCYCDFQAPHACLSKEEICSFLGQLRVTGQNLDLHLLGGEPFMREDLFELISCARKKVRKILIFTNATLIDARRAAMIKASGVTAVIVTLHSCDPLVHDRITHVQGAWERTVAGIRYLVAAGVATYTFSVIMSHNAATLPAIEDFVTGLGAKTMYFPYIKQCGSANGCSAEEGDYHKALSWVYGKSPRYTRKLIAILRKRPKVCSAFVSTLNVKAEGTVTPCPFLDLALGNIREERFYSILEKACNNAALLDFLSIPEACGGCSLVDYCGGGCKAFRFNAYRDAFSRDEHCRGPFKEKVPVEKIGSYLPYVF